jgi:hypothetical protein
MTTPNAGTGDFGIGNSGAINTVFRHFRPQSAVAVTDHGCWLNTEITSSVR